MFIKRHQNHDQKRARVSRKIVFSEREFEFEFEKRKLVSFYTRERAYAYNKSPEKKI